jgi:hypothetical protein
MLPSLNQQSGIYPFGHEWSIAVHMKDLSPEEIRKGVEHCFAKAHEGFISLKVGKKRGQR